jgi:hypothetical protein
VNSEISLRNGKCFEWQEIYRVENPKSIGLVRNKQKSRKTSDKSDIKETSSEPHASA